MSEENTEQLYNETSSSFMRDRSPASVDFDNLIRRKLRVSDPNNHKEIAEALGKLYVTNRQEMEAEASGLPFIMAPPTHAEIKVPTSSSAELEQAKRDVERDLTSLINNSLLKDIQPELNGWGTAIRTAISDGVNAARFSLDPRQRDKTFAVRRMLGDYARIARFVGAMTPTLSLPYRRLAQSLDEVSAVLLVLMGEALANIGFSGGRFLLQVPQSELQERRDAVIYALRNLVGTTQQAFNSKEWPRGLVAYSDLLNRLESSGHSDLRVLFQENHLARLMDNLVDLAASGSSDAMRALGATAHIALESFRRLIIFGNRLVDPESPQLTTFLKALRFFLDPFEHASSGNRLLYISRPPIVFYGLYGIGGPNGNSPSQMLLNLVGKRGLLANMLDCYLGCDCGEGRVKCQIVLDKILYDLDRAIDLYIFGTDPNGRGEPEQRAAAYGFIIHQVLSQEDPNLRCFGNCNDSKLNSLEKEIKKTLEEIMNTLWQADTEEMHIGKFTVKFDSDTDEFEETDIKGFGELVAHLKEISEHIEKIKSNPEIEMFSVNPEFPSVLNDMSQELCVQKYAEKQWEKLLKAMAPSCIKSKNIMDVIQTIIDGAIEQVAGEGYTCPKDDVTIPPHHETSWGGFTYLRSSEGKE